MQEWQCHLISLLRVLSHWGQKVNLGLNFIPFQQHNAGGVCHGHPPIPS